MGDKRQISRSTLADANEVRDWCIYAEVALSIIGIARCLYAGEPFGLLSRGRTHPPQGCRGSGEKGAGELPDASPHVTLPFPAERKALDSCLGRHFDDAGKRHDDTLQVRG
jgi:hypothetical protein